MTCRICNGQGYRCMHYDEALKTFVPLLCLSCMGSGVVDDSTRAWERAVEEVRELWRDTGGEA